MKKLIGGAALDHFRIVAAILVITIHTSPLLSVNATADFVLTRVLARAAVPFFLMVTGYFLGRKIGREARTCKKLLLLYGAAILLYLPLNLYAGGFSPLEALKMLLVDGTFYHLWYFPATLLGILVVFVLRKLRVSVRLSLAGGLYLLGLLGDSYYGLIEGIPVLKNMYEGIFAVSSYTRNGLFFAPLFLLLGMAARTWSRKISIVGLSVSLAAMCVEALLLRQWGGQRHDSMYLLLPVCMVFLFSLLLRRNQRERPGARSVSMLLFLLHPWCIVLVRGAAKLLRLEPLLVGNSLLHFLAVCLLTLLLCLLLYAIRPLRVPPTARAWREIDLAALCHNAALLQSRLGGSCSLMAVVKADAYGHGAVAVARALSRHEVKAFAVACLSEGIALRKSGIRGTILVLGWTDPAQAELLSRWRLTQTVVDEAHGKALDARGKRLHVHIALDTGMHRLGISAGNFDALRRTLRRKNLIVDGIFTHLCVSNCLAEEEASFTQRQAAQFFEAADALRQAGLHPGKTHIQASYGIWNGDPQPCDYARVGIALYGVRSDDSPVCHPLDLWPVLSLRARISNVRTLSEGERAGYGRAFLAERETLLAVAAIGYADGVPRDWADGGSVLIHGQRVPVAGICMDQMLVDVTDLSGEVCPGDVVTLIGRDGGVCIQAEEMARSCGSITNELLSRLGGRLALHW